MFLRLSQYYMILVVECFIPDGKKKEKITTGFILSKKSHEKTRSNMLQSAILSDSPKPFTTCCVWITLEVYDSEEYAIYQLYQPVAAY